MYMSAINAMKASAPVEHPFRNNPRGAAYSGDRAKAGALCRDMSSVIVDRGRRSLVGYET
jgi:hypothetical protein